MGPHRTEENRVAAAGCPPESYRCGVRVEIAGVGLQPAGGVIDVGHLGGIGVGRAQPEVHRCDDHTGCGQLGSPVIRMGAVAPVPRAAVDIEQRRKGARSLGLVDADQPAFFPVAQVLLLMDLDFV